MEIYIFFYRLDVGKEHGNFHVLFRIFFERNMEISMFCSILWMKEHENFLVLFTLDECKRNMEISMF